MPAQGNGKEMLYLGRYIGLEDRVERVKKCDSPSFLDINKEVENALEKKYDFLVVSLGGFVSTGNSTVDAGSNAGDDAVAAGDEDDVSIQSSFRPSVRSALEMKSSLWSSVIVADIGSSLVSVPRNVPGNSNINSVIDTTGSYNSRIFLKKLEVELSFVQHLGTYGALLPAPPANLELLDDYAAWLNRYCLSSTPETSLAIKFPVLSRDGCTVRCGKGNVRKEEMKKDGFMKGDGNADGANVVDGWSLWNRFRSLLDPSISLNICLMVGDMSGKGVDDYPLTNVELDRWYGESVKYIVLQKDAYLMNAKGYPVLSKRGQSFVKGFFDHGVHFLMEEEGMLQGVVGGMGAMGGMESMGGLLGDGVKSVGGVLGDVMGSVGVDGSAEESINSSLVDSSLNVAFNCGETIKRNASTMNCMPLEKKSPSIDPTATATNDEPTAANNEATPTNAINAILTESTEAVIKAGTEVEKEDKKNLVSSNPSSNPSSNLLTVPGTLNTVNNNIGGTSGIGAAAGIFGRERVESTLTVNPQTPVPVLEGSPRPSFGSFRDFQFRDRGSLDFDDIMKSNLIEGNDLDLSGILAGFSCQGSDVEMVDEADGGKESEKANVKSEGEKEGNGRKGGPRWGTLEMLNPKRQQWGSMASLIADLGGVGKTIKEEGDDRMENDQMEIDGEDNKDDKKELDNMSILEPVRLLDSGSETGCDNNVCNNMDMIVREKPDEKPAKPTLTLPGVNRIRGEKPSLVRRDSKTSSVSSSTSVARVNTLPVDTLPDNNPIDTSKPDPEAQRLLYLVQLFKRRPLPSFRQRFEKPYYDILQVPLQPLWTHLNSGTYETFEEDPIKYRLYENAIMRRICDILRGRAEEMKEKMKKVKGEKKVNVLSNGLLDSPGSSEDDGEGDVNMGGDLVLANMASPTSSAEGNNQQQDTYYGRHRGTSVQLHVKKMSELLLGVGDEETAIEEPLYIIDELIPEKFQKIDFLNTVVENKTINAEATDNTEAIDNTKPTETMSEPITLVVAGAGRGPLVQACLNAIEVIRTKVYKLPRFSIKIVEKNPNAVFTLRYRLEEEWSGAMLKWQGVDVELLGPVDMRSLKQNLNADILISELLGSFSDNELSPECLDMAIPRCLKQGGCCIPQKYWSTLQLISTPRIWNELAEKAHRGGEKAKEQFEFGYVVALKAYFPISDSKDCFVFSHKEDAHDPKRLKQPKTGRNERRETVRLTAETDARCHGFAGYFDCELYDNVRMSIDPVTRTERMISWFPIYFPIREPFDVKEGEEVEVTFWRLEDNSKVWYEWCCRMKGRSLGGGVHNVNGRSYKMMK